MSISLAATESGAGSPVAILHGLFGSGRNWASIAQRLALHHRVVAFDLRNHGASPWADDMGYAGMAGDVLAAMRARGYPRFALIGHSMGGKTAMLAALEDAAAIERLVVVDIAPVPYPPHHLAEVRALKALDLAGINRRSEADARLTAIPDKGERGFLLQNLVLEPEGARWRVNLAAIEREMSVLSGFPIPAPGARYDGPTLFVAGARSDFVQPEHEGAIRTLFPRAEIATIADAGHWLHAEQPAAFLALVEPFLTAAA